MGDSAVVRWRIRTGGGIQKYRAGYVDWTTVDRYSSFTHLDDNPDTLPGYYVSDRVHLEYRDGDHDPAGHRRSRRDDGYTSASADGAGDHLRVVRVHDAGSDTAKRHRVRQWLGDGTADVQGRIYP